MEYKYYIILDNGSNTEVQDFMTGSLRGDLAGKIMRKCREIVTDEGVDLICFVPGDTESITVLRYGKLAELLAGVYHDVYLDGVSACADPESTFRCDKTRVKGKQVLVIGGIYQKGTTFHPIAQLLTNNGAKSVCGLFVANN